MFARALKSLFSRPSTAAASFSAAFALYQEGRLEEALAHCDRIKDASNADVDYLRGLITERQGDLKAAVRHFRAASTVRPEEASFQYSLGQAELGLGLISSGRLALDRFLAVAPEDDARRVPALVAWARTLSPTDPARESLLDRASIQAEADPTAALQLADASYADDDIVRARRSLGWVRGDAQSAASVRRAMMLPAIYQSRQHIIETRETLARDLAELMSAPLVPVAMPEHAIGVLPFYLAYHNASNADLMRHVGQVMRKATGWHASPVQRKPQGRIRVGFVSTYFYSHSIGRITHGPIRDLPRDRFEVFVFAIAPQTDAMQRSIEADAEHYRPLPDEVAAAREAIEAARLDALIFADIGMHPTTYFLAMHRLAPVQVALWGHPETTGLDTIDYFFTAAGVETEGADSHYTERLVRSKSFFLGGFQRPARAMPLSREALGLPLQSTVYACLQPAFKIHPDMDAAFAGIFERDPKAHLLLLEGRPSWAHRLRQRFARSIPGHQHRMHWLPTLPHARFMATLACADVSLDPLYFGGGNSSCEALAQGIPLVTLPGTHAYGRLSLALCQEMNELRGIASSVDDYVDRAVDLANQTERHAMRQDIAERATVLFDRRDISLALGEFLASAVAAIA